MMALRTYPLDDIPYEAGDAELFHCTRTSGIWTEQDFPLTNMGNNQIKVGKGIAWIRNQEFAGKVAALKVPETVPMGIANGTYPRIDVIALRFSVNDNETTVVLKQGAPASNPVRPAITRTGDIYELYLASVYRPAGATSITAANITDLRLDSSVCGLMADSVTSVDTTLINAQINGFVSDWNTKSSNSISAFETKSNASISAFETRADELVEDTQAAVDDIVSGTDVMFKSEWTSNGVIPSSKIDTGIIPISKGGTGKTTASEALAALGGTSIELLWQNASPTSEFPAQNIQIPVGSYDEIVIIYRIANTSIYKDIGYGVDSMLISIININNSSSIYFASREILKNNNGLTIKNAELKLNTTSSSPSISVANSFLIPLKIYGIKI